MALDFQNLHVLVVEDIIPMQKLTAQILKTLGVGRVSVAKNGYEGYETYLHDNPDVILTDWQMAEM